MSNPVTNRWGLNLFWYRWWYNDKISTLLYHQDSLIERLIYTYINYGSTHTKSTFSSKYWISRTFAQIKDYALVYMLKVTRHIEYTSKTFGDKLIRKARVKPNALYHSKIWILRFQGWLILNFYFFQPLKKIKVNKIKTSKSTGSIVNYDSMKHEIVILRQKLILFYFFQTIFSKKINYVF